MAYNLSTVGSVYFLIRGDLVKVGFSTNVQSRIVNFQHDSGDLLAVIPDATPRDERACHTHLAQWHVKGEWFRADPEFLDAVQWLMSGGLSICATENRKIRAKELSAIARLGAHTSWANTEDRSERTAPARRALEAKFLDQADGDPVRAEHIRKAYYQRLALKSAQARRQRSISRRAVQQS